MWKRILSVVCLLTIAAAATAAVPRITWPIPPVSGDQTAPSVVSLAPLHALVAWEEEGSVLTVESEAVCTGLPLDVFTPVDHGPGAKPVAGHLPDDTRITAFLRGSDLVIREGDDTGAWADAAVLPLSTPPGPGALIDIWCSPYPEFPWTAWIVVSSDGSDIVDVTRRTYWGWNPVESLMPAGLDGWWHPFAQIVDHDGPSGPLPRLHYVGWDAGMPRLMRLDALAGGVWDVAAVCQTATGPVEFAGGEFDVVRDLAGYGYVYLGTGMQPACPCNVVLFAESSGGVWSDAVNLTVSVDSYDWPMSPRLGAGDGGRLHAFWSQLGSAPNLEPHSMRLCHFVREPGADWEDRSADVEGWDDVGLHERVSLDVSSADTAVLAFALTDTVEGTPQPAAVWLSWYDHCAFPEDVPPFTGVALSAAPNPFNPRTVITVTGGAVDALEIVDVRGRVVATLQVEPLGPEAGRAVWDGRAADGREVPSGAYLARVRGVGTAMTKLVLTR